MQNRIIRKTRKMLMVDPNLKNYEKMFRNFEWKQAYDELYWFKKYTSINAAYNAIDRHVKLDKKALIWIGENGRTQSFTFSEMSRLSNRFANILKNNGVRKGDRVFFFLSRVPELYIGFLGTLKTGAIAGTMFAAFGPNAIRDRLKDSKAKILVTDSVLKKRVYKIIKELPDLKRIIVVGKASRGELSYVKEMKAADDNFNIVKTKKNDPCFMLYTSGTTGKPKGIVHTHKAIIVQHMTSKWVLDLHKNDVFWCTADPGWVTGISYSILGPWSNGVTTVVYGGRFDPAKWYSIIDKYKVSVWYTAPTAVRMLEKAGSNVVKKYDLRSLRYMCSVGEPLSPEPILWGMKTFGLPFHDNWWQTETGGILIGNYASMPIKLGSMGKPIPGVKAGIVNDIGNELGAGKVGNLTIRPGWPSMMQRVWGNNKKYRSYFKKGWYITGDLAWRDKNGYYWFVGRADDIIKTSGERVGPFEVESALIEHKAVAEAGVIGKPDPLRGEIIKAFVVLASGYSPSKTLEDDIKKFVKERLAGHAYPREIEFVRALPKTRSGKIMRRVLKAKELGLPTGDLSTMEKF